VTELNNIACYSITFLVMTSTSDAGESTDLVLIDPQSVGKRTHDGHCQCEKEMEDEDLLACQ
jgi:hypothetical protein